ncbi:hypothetical protein [Nostoc sp. NMS4]|uniref:hypothetical protein n=1 Tax=Nostoc sp. NMS4 TaxID=2815390 RepID=UPI0025F23241|nr:hypothetical protein [Nostoc sp. NMS4]
MPTREERLNCLAEINVVAQVKNLYQTSIIRQVLHERKAPMIQAGLCQNGKIVR